jgi:hypothetical protein
MHVIRSRLRLGTRAKPQAAAPIIPRYPRNPVLTFSDIL